MEIGLRGVEFREVVPDESEEHDQRSTITCADLKRWGVISEEIPDCCPYCETDTHENEDEDEHSYVTTPKGRVIIFCCICYDHVPVSVLINIEPQCNAWLDEALDKHKETNNYGSIKRNED